MLKNKFIIIWPVIFREFDYYRLELNKIEKYFDIEVHELSDVFDLKLSKIYDPKVWCKRKIVKRYKSLMRWVIDFKNIKKNYKTVVMYNFHSNSFFKYLVRLILALSNTKVIKYSKSNLNDVKINSEIIIYKLKKNFSFEDIFFYINNFLFRFMGSFFKSNFILSMSHENYLLLKKKLAGKSIILKASSYDYSNALVYKPNKKDLIFGKKKYSILIDTPGPRNKGDEVVYRFKEEATNERWYPAVNKFFLFLEKKYRTKFVIAPHPKTKPKKFSKEFQYRQTLFNKLAYSVKKAKIIVSKVPGSTAVIYAAMFKKPLLFIYSNEYQKQKNAMNNFKSMIKEFKTKAVNIDKNYNMTKINNLMKVNNKTYEKYIRKFGTARNDFKPNNIILRELLNHLFYKKKLKI